MNNINQDEMDALHDVQANCTPLPCTICERITPWHNGNCVRCPAWEELARRNIDMLETLISVMNRRWYDCDSIVTGAVYTDASGEDVAKSMLNTIKDMILHNVAYRNSLR